MTLRHVLAASAILLAGSGCGPTPPQAPLPEAKKLDESTSSISSACGESYQLNAFPGADRRDIDTLEATAASAAQKLASVYRRNATWIYQSETIAKIVQDSRSALHDCGLHGAEAVLAAQTRKRAP
jgi:hypothetical protein